MDAPDFAQVGCKVLLETGGLKIAKRMKESGTLVRQLAGIRTRVAGGSDSGSGRRWGLLAHSE